MDTTTPSPIVIKAVRGVPDADEVAAIAAAIEMAWPRPAVANHRPDPAPVWRFSGRWWATPLVRRRARP